MITFFCQLFSIIVIGGYSNGVACSQDTYILNTQSGSWVKGPDLKTGRVDVACGAVRNSQVSCTTALAK